MDDEPTGPPSEEAEAQRLETVSPVIWAMVGTALVLMFVVLMVGLGRPGPKVHSPIHLSPAGSSGLAGP